MRTLVVCFLIGVVIALLSPQGFYDDLFNLRRLGMPTFGDLSAPLTITFAIFLIGLVLFLLSIFRVIASGAGSVMIGLIGGIIIGTLLSGPVQSQLCAWNNSSFCTVSTHKTALK